MSDKENNDVLMIHLMECTTDSKDEGMREMEIKDEHIMIMVEELESKESKFD